MHRTFCSLFALCIIFLIETRQHFAIPQVGNCDRNLIGDKSCPDDYKYNEINCRCEKIDLNINGHNAQSANGSEVSKAITNDNTSAPKPHCKNNEKWNGSACILEAIICPGGYQWNGNACIMQTSVQTAALIPSSPDLKCKHAQKLSRLADEQKLPLTTMPIYSTSPSCPFSFVLSDNNECVKQLPTCPYGYVYQNEGCYLGSKPVHHYFEDNPQLIKPIKNYPDAIFAPLNINDSLQMPSFGFRPNLSRTPPIIPNQTINPYPIFGAALPSLAYRTPSVKESHSRREECCSIISPRICRRIANRSNAQWQCYNHKYNRCGNVCTKPKIQLRPRKSSFTEPLLVMRPPPRRLMKISGAQSFSETKIGTVFDFDMIHSGLTLFTFFFIFIYRLFRVLVWCLCLFK